MIDEDYIGMDPDLIEAYKKLGMVPHMSVAKGRNAIMINLVDILERLEKLEERSGDVMELQFDNCKAKALRKRQGLFRS